MRTRRVNISQVRKEARFDGSYFNAEGNLYNEIVSSHSTHPLSYYCRNIFTSSRGRRTYTNENKGVPFLSNSDMVAQDPFNSCKFSSKKYAFDEDAVLKEGMILTGRVGAIGQIAFVPDYWEKAQAMGSDNIIRIDVQPKYKNGYIYAYLASKVGNLSFWKHATGGVQPYITDSMVGGLPIPDISSHIQEYADSLIKESARLREVSIEALHASHKIVESYFPAVPSKNNCQSVSIKDIWSSQAHRMESSYHIADGKFYDAFIRDNFLWKPLGDVSKSISRPDIFKRMYVDNGITFLGGTDIMLSIPDSKKKLSKKTPHIDDFMVDEGWILLPRSGTIGDVVYTTSQHAQKLVSEDVIRIIPNDILSGGYVFAFLSSKIGRALIQRPIFGSVIQHVEPPLLKTMPIPVIEDEKMEEISDLAETYRSAWGEACKKELEAISLVEAEIEKWNK